MIRKILLENFNEFFMPMKIIAIVKIEKTRHLKSLALNPSTHPHPNILTNKTVSK